MIRRIQSKGEPKSSSPKRDGGRMKFKIDLKRREIIFIK